MTSASGNILRARRVMSSRLPTGVATIYNFPAAILLSAQGDFECTEPSYMAALFIYYFIDKCFLNYDVTDTQEIEQRLLFKTYGELHCVRYSFNIFHRWQGFMITEKKLRLNNGAHIKCDIFPAFRFSL